jgi:hypothetical protein
MPSPKTKTPKTLTAPGPKGKTGEKRQPSPNTILNTINQTAERLVQEAGTLLGQHPLSGEAVNHLAWLATELDRVNVLIEKSDFTRALATIKALPQKVSAIDASVWGGLDGGEDYMDPALREGLATRLWRSAESLLRWPDDVKAGWLGLVDAGQHLDLALAILGGVPQQIRHAASMDTLVFKQVPLDVYQWIAKDMESGYGLDRGRIRARKEKELLQTTLPDASEPTRAVRRM